MTHRVHAIEFEYFQQGVVGERFNRHMVPVLSCTAAWVNDDDYDEYIDEKLPRVGCTYDPL